LLLEKLFHEYPQTDPVIPKSSSGMGFPAFLDTGDQEEPVLIPGPPGFTGATGLPGPVIFLDPDQPEDPIVIPGAPGAKGDKGDPGDAGSGSGGTGTILSFGDVDPSEDLPMVFPGTPNLPYLIADNLSPNQSVSTDVAKKLVSTNLTTNQVPYKSATLMVDSPIYIDGSLVSIGIAPAGAAAQFQVQRSDAGPVYSRINAPSGNYAILELTEDQLNPWQILHKPTTHELQFWNTDYWMTLTTAGVLNLKQLTPSRVVVTDVDKNLVSGSNTDAEIADAVTRRNLSVFVEPAEPPEDLPMIPPGILIQGQGPQGQPGPVMFLEPDQPEDPIVIPGAKGDKGDKGDPGEAGSGSGGTGTILSFGDVDPSEDLPMVFPGNPTFKKFPFFDSTGAANNVLMLDGPSLPFFNAAGSSNNIGVVT